MLLDQIRRPLSKLPRKTGDSWLGSKSAGTTKRDLQEMTGLPSLKNTWAPSQFNTVLPSNYKV